MAKNIFHEKNYHTGDNVLIPLEESLKTLLRDRK